MKTQNTHLDLVGIELTPSSSSPRKMRLSTKRKKSGTPSVDAARIGKPAEKTLNIEGIIFLP